MQVSIHHMCRFKLVKEMVLQHSNSRFNTSYVSVQEENKPFLNHKHHRFNTSYVSVQVNLKIKITFIFRVSIHHMCRFKYHIYPFKRGCDKVSIHHMCRFKIVLKKRTKILKRFQYIICVGSSWLPTYQITSSKEVSIHHMCRFKIIPNIQRKG